MNPANGSRSERGAEPLLFSGDTYRVLAVAIGTIGLFGFCNNFVVLALYCRFARLRTPTNLLLLNISLSDLLVSLIGINFTFAACLQGRWTWTHATCVWDGFSNSLFGESSSFTSPSVLQHHDWGGGLKDAPLVGPFASLGPPPPGAADLTTLSLSVVEPSWGLM